MVCRVCQHEMVEKELVEGCRVEHLRYCTEPFTMRQADLLSYQCPNCAHIQLEYQLEQNYYQEYVGGSTGFAQYFGSLNKTEKRVKKLSQYANSKESLIEIGCGIGQALVTAKNYFSACFGVEPSENDAKEAEKTGCTIFNAYFDQELRFDRKFSAFMNFQVFEHLDDLYAVLRYAYETLEPNGVGLINVPNGQEIFWQGYYHQVTAEHINYFSPYSLAVMARQAGFEIIEIESAEDTIELDLYVRKQDVSLEMNRQKQKQKENLTYFLEGYSVISIWGAGAKAHIYSGLLEPNVTISHLMDSSSAHLGEYVSGISVPIEPISQKIIDESDAIVIFASAYNSEIMRDLKEKYRYQGAVIFFEGQSVKSIRE